MEAEVGRICDSGTELCLEEYMALDRLMGALLTGEVIAMPRRQFINVMEELVISQAISRVAEVEREGESILDVGDIAAYALNRLPPLYATTEEGANYQRQRAREELQGLISQQVDEAMERFMTRPTVGEEERNPLVSSKGSEKVLVQMSHLLKSYAVNYEAGRSN
jgi:hypothetical protein